MISSNSRPNIGHSSNNIDKRIRELLEDFEISAAGTRYIALVPKYSFDNPLFDNVHAAVVASHLRLQSIDYAKKNYCQGKSTFKGKNKQVDQKYIEAYKSAKKHIEKEISRLSTTGRELPPLGVFGASIVLERLRASFFSAHILYRLGNEYEAHAVSRLILEQIAWAYAAYPLDEINSIKRIATTRTISELKKLIPASARLYGFLSEKTHIDYDNHSEFIEVMDGRNMILLSQNQYYDYATVMLSLADIFGIVWEISQFDYMKKKESVEKRGTSFVVKEERPFVKIMERHLNRIEKASNR